MNPGDTSPEIVFRTGHGDGVSRQRTERRKASSASSLQGLSPPLQIARSKASNQISEDIPLTRAGELETTARRCGSPYDLALRSPTPSCALQNTEAQSYVTRWPCTRHLTSSSSAANADPRLHFMVTV